PLLPGPRKQLFGVNLHQYWLPVHDGNFWDYGLQPQAPLKVAITGAGDYLTFGQKNTHIEAHRDSF
ncbi:hypothetical protein, partial [Pseudomonas amygdali]|uniref:hypothetical protein n=1 Tax=Pseudomonas amygdali TaxID=47877 RepID=UPI001C11A426